MPHSLIIVWELRGCPIQYKVLLEIHGHDHSDSSLTPTARWNRSTTYGIRMLLSGGESRATADLDDGPAPNDDSDSKNGLGTGGEWDLPAGMKMNKN